MEKVEISHPIVEQKSSVRVTKNSKGYNWDIKVYDDDPKKALDKMIKLELKCQKEYGEGQSLDIMGEDEST